MSVAVDSNTGASADATGVTSLNLTTFTVGATSDRALTVFLGWDRTTITAVTGKWDNTGTPQSMTQVIAKNTTDASTRAEIWGLIAPTSGNKTLNFAWTTAAELIITLVSFQGADQGAVGTTFVNATSNAASTANPSVAVTSATNNYTSAVVSAANDVPGSPTQTNVLDVSGAGFDNTGASIAAGAASVTHGWTMSAVPWAICGCDIVAVGAAGGSAAVRNPSTMTLTGVQ